MRRGWLGLVTIGLAASLGTAQAPPALLEPVHWSAEAMPPRPLTVHSRFTALLHASIEDGWHLYALPEKDGFPLATEIALAKNASADLLRVDEEKPRHSVESGSNVVTGWFARSTTFTLRLTVVSAPLRDLQVLVRYQACNERMCLPTRQVAVPVQLATGK